MCNTIYPAKAVVIIKSKYDDHYWIVRGDRKVEKLSPTELGERFATCINYPDLTYCPERGEVLVWGPRGLSAVGFAYAEISEDLWCNIKRLAKLLKDKLPDPIDEATVDNARKEVEWLLSIPVSSEPITA